MQYAVLRPLLALAVLFAVTRPTALAESPIDSPEQKVLDRSVGNWRATYKVSKAEWTPEERLGTAEISTSRVVGGRFVQEKSEHSDKTSGSTIVTYDAQKRQYRGWWFSSAGHYSSEISGNWDPVKKTMTWTSTQDGLTTTTDYRFIDNDNIEWVVSVKDGDGKTFYRMDGRSVRLIKPEK